MSEIIERVARAIFGDQYWDDDGRESNSDRGRYGPTRTERIERARAGLSAIREPTSAMKSAANDAFPDAPYEITCGELGGRIWRAMIDEALK